MEGIARILAKRQLAGLLRPQNYMKAANLSTNKSFGRIVVYGHIKHLRYGHTLRRHFIVLICINSKWPPLADSILM